MPKQINCIDFADNLRAIFGQDPQQVARTLAHRLIEELKIEKPPVDPAVFLSHYGIAFVELGILDDGFLTTAERLRDHVNEFPWVGPLTGDVTQCDAKTPVIVVGKLPPLASRSRQRRRRFVTMHEFAHWYLRRQIELHIGPATFRHNDAEEEALCNVIAAELLVPNVFFAQDASEPESLATSAIQLADKYDVTLSTLLVKAAASVEKYAAFALFDRSRSVARLSFTTPARSQSIFRDSDLRRDVMLAFKTVKPQRRSYQFKVSGKTRELGACHVKVDNNSQNSQTNQVLSFVFAEPYAARRIHSHA
jgi:hypothetical protein